MSAVLKLLPEKPLRFVAGVWRPPKLLGVGCCGVLPLFVLLDTLVTLKLHSP